MSETEGYLSVPDLFHPLHNTLQFAQLVDVFRRYQISRNNRYAAEFILAAAALVKGGGYHQLVR
jgi:hypothetical protein